MGCFFKNGMFLRIFFSFKGFREGDFLFHENWGFPILSPSYVTNWESPPKKVCYRY